MHSSSTAGRGALAANCVASLCWAFNFGLGAPLAALWLQDAGYGATVIGLNTGVYYLGIALAAVLVPWLLRRWGRGCPLFGVLVSALTVALFPWGGGLFGWFLLRFLNGVGGALTLIPMETHVNQNCTDEQRARNFGFYAFSVAVGIALGTLIGLQMYGTLPQPAFIVGGLAPLISIVAIVGWLSWPVPPAEPMRSRTPLPLGATFLSLGSAWSQGYLEGGMVSLVPVYLLAIGLSDDGVSWLMSGTMVGVIVFQVPVAWLADRLGRTRVLLGCYGVTAAALAFLPYCGPGIWLGVWLFFAGACSGAFYPLGLSILGERLPKTGLARANAWYLGINCVGSLTGPAITGVLMDLLGRRALFASGEAAVLLVLAACVVVRLGTRWQARNGPSEIVPTPESQIRPAA